MATGKECSSEPSLWKAAINLQLQPMTVPSLSQLPAHTLTPPPPPTTTKSARKLKIKNTLPSRSIWNARLPHLAHWRLGIFCECFKVYSSYKGLKDLTTNAEITQTVFPRTNSLFASSPDSYTVVVKDPIPLASQVAQNCRVTHNRCVGSFIANCTWRCDYRHQNSCKPLFGWFQSRFKSPATFIGPPVARCSYARSSLPPTTSMDITDHLKRSLHVSQSCYQTWPSCSRAFETFVVSLPQSYPANLPPTNSFDGWVEVLR